MRKKAVLLATSALSAATSGLLWPFATIDLYELGGSMIQIVSLDALPALSYVLSIVWGALSDYYENRRAFIIAGQLLAVVPLIAASRVRDPVLFTVAMLATNFLYSISSPSFFAALGEAGGSAMYAYSELASALGWTAGAAAIGLLYSAGGEGTVYTAAVTFVVSSALMIALFYKEERAEVRREELARYLGRIFKLELRASREMKAFLASMFVAWASAYWTSALLKVKLYRLLGASVESYSAVFGVAGLASAAASLIAARVVEKVGGVALVAFSIAAYSILVPMLGAVPEPSAFAILYCIPIWPLFWTGQLAATFELSRKGAEGESMGALMAVTSASSIPAVAGALVAERAGLDIAIILGGLLNLVPLVLLVRIGPFGREDLGSPTPRTAYSRFLAPS